MKLFSLNNQVVKSITSKDFKLEKDIQNLVEKNLEEFFHLQFVSSELIIKNFRIDTLGFNRENKSFVIIEYKKERNYSVIDQGYTYLSLMLNNKSDFILEFNEKNNGSLKRDDVDWTQSKVVFISPQFTEYQKHSVNFKDVPFELWEIKMYENNTIGLIQHKTTSSESISTISSDSGNVISQVSKEVKIYDEEYHLTRSKSRPEWVNELYFSLKDRILNLGEVEIQYRGNYISFRRKRPFIDVIFWNKGLVLMLNLKKGTLNDTNSLTKDISGVGHWGNGDYQITMDNKTDLDYVMFLINQSYKYQENE
jgi:predicted transport protein